MRSSSQWTAVNLSSDTPQLLMKTRFDRTGYRIQLTDLSRIWEETLSKQEIIQRAVENSCSFNPGDDDGNYDTFLKSIRRALNGETKTTSNLRAGDSGKLFLDSTTPLSGGLPDLRWTAELDQLPESAVATEIVGPLLLQANSLQHQIQQLVDEISSKDHVIQKITDKLEATGSDLTAVFPGVSNVKTSKKRGLSQRAQFAGHVKGLADFDEAAWKKSHEELSEGQEMTPKVMDAVLRDLPSPGRVEQPTGNWVQNLASVRDGSQARPKVPARSKNHYNDKVSPVAETQDEGFQRQETPPHLAKPTATKKRSESPPKPAPTAQVAHTGDDSETEDEDEDCLDIPPTTSQQQAMSTIEPSDHSEEVQQPKTTRNETQTEDIDKVQPPQPDSNEDTDELASSPPVQKAPVKIETHDTELDAEPEKPVRRGGLGKFGGAKPKSDPPVEDDEKETEPSPTKPKGTLGKFGGKKAQPPISTPEPVESTSKPKSSLGRFGGKAKNTSTDQAVKKEEQDESAGNVESKPSFSRRTEPEAEPEPERALTEEEKQQRADEKREKLKRELEEKAKGPVKKKRKF